MFINPIVNLDDFNNRKPSYRREIGNLIKCYSNNSKYSSSSNNFSLKLKIFSDTYKRIGLPKVAYKLALPIILKGLVINYYYILLLNIKDILLFNKLYNKIKNYFKDTNYIYSILTK